MKVLNQIETLHWLQQQGHVEDPHRNLDLANLPKECFYASHYAPRGYGSIASFADYYLNQVLPDGDMLLQIIEWDLWWEPTSFVIKSLLPTFDETCVYGQMGGFLLERSENAKAIALLALTTSFGWKSYLYGEGDRTVLYTWEGEIVDFWTLSGDRHAKIANLFDKFKLAPVKRTKQ